jgi:hypothetical protein
MSTAFLTPREYRNSAVLGSRIAPRHVRLSGLLAQSAAGWEYFTKRRVMDQNTPVRNQVPVWLSRLDAVRRAA